ncbi:hypothetical protein EPO05_01600 [Patescibacteria group bacterium]|nr:MAG: hypothetical protein EPO05_01600 [Patescibacteria group bacterium]
MRSKEVIKPNESIAQQIDRLISAVKHSLSFQGDGDLIIFLSENKSVLRSKARDLADKFFSREIESSSLNQEQLKKICEGFVEGIPLLINEMQRETEENVVKRFISFYYEPDYSGTSKRKLILTEPSADRIRRGAKDEIVFEIMQGLLGRSPAGANVYNFSARNLEFLRPRVIELVEQLLSDYKAQTDLRSA